METSWCKDMARCDGRHHGLGLALGGKSLRRFPEERSTRDSGGNGIVAFTLWLPKIRESLSKLK